MKLASSLPKGDSTRKAILVGLTKGVNKNASKTLVIEGLDPQLQAKIDSLVHNLHREIKKVAMFDCYLDMEFKSNPSRYEEHEQVENNISRAGFGLIGSIIKPGIVSDLSPAEKKIITNYLKGKGIGVADTKSLKSTLEMEANEWSWEDTSQGFATFWQETSGKAVDALTLNKFVSKL